MAHGKYEQPRRRRRRRINPTFPIFVLMVLAVVALLAALLLRGCGAAQDDIPDTLPTDEAVVPGDVATVPSEQITLPTAQTTEPTQMTTEATAVTTEPETTEPKEEAAGPEPETSGATEETQALSTGQQVANSAREQIGKPYLYGGSGPDSFDTTGLIHYCHKDADVDVPRQLSSLISFGTEVASQDDLLPGDVVFFWTDTPDQPQHPAIYVGGGKVVAAFKTDVPVGEVSLSESYYSEHYVTARRLH